MTRPVDFREDPRAGHWKTLIALASNYTDPAWDPWRVWTLPAGGLPDLLPEAGPVVYVALDPYRCFWAGQTEDLRNRFRGHMSHAYRLARWQTVLAIKLRPDTPARIVNRLERDTATRFKPIDGRAWPRAAVLRRGPTASK